MKTHIHHVRQVRGATTHQVRQRTKVGGIVRCNLFEAWTGIERIRRLRQCLTVSNMVNTSWARNQAKEGVITGQSTHPSNETSSSGSTAVTVYVNHYVDPEPRGVRTHLGHIAPRPMG